MRVRQLRVSSFRGWRELELRPRGHVVVVGEPRAGRSDLVEALRRVLDPDATRTPPGEFDVYMGELADDGPDADEKSEPADVGEDEALDDLDGDTQVRVAEVEVVLAELGEALEQHFFRRLEVWDTDSNVLVEKSADGELDEDRHELVLRLCYRLRWSPEEGDGEHWVDYPKTSDPDSDSYDRVRRPDRLMLPFVYLAPGQPLTLRSGSAFRELLESGGDDLAATLQALSDAVDVATDGLSATTVISGVLDGVFAPVRGTLDIDDQTAIADVVSFRAEGGSVAGLLRALQPTLRLGAEALPLRRHGSTTAAVLAAAEALVLARHAGALVVCDDFGDQLDAGAAEHLARELRISCDQLWMSTRRPDAARAFRPGEMVRLSRRSGERAAHQMAEPADKKELSVVRQLHLQLLPAMSSRAIVVFEGRHDVAALTSISHRRTKRALPAAYGVRFIESDGHTEVIKICRLARQLGFRVIAGLDFDKPGQGADTSFAEAQKVADDVVRLPERFAIERAIVHGVPRQSLIDAFTELDSQWQLGLAGIDKLADRDLEKRVAMALHRSGLHPQYIYLLPWRKGKLPKVAIEFLDTAVELARGTVTGPVTLTA